jgi:prepilin-type processing-associated H-X9-DG protein
LQTPHPFVPNTIATSDINGNPLLPAGTHGSSGQRTCWVVYLLPYLEQDNLYRKIYAFLSANGYAYLDTTDDPAVVPNLWCPSDRNSPNDGKSGPYNQGFQGNYALCGGSSDLAGPSSNGTGLSGVFFAASNTRIADITDGTSTTLAGSESLVPFMTSSPSTDDMRGRYWNAYAMAESLMSTGQPPNTSAADKVWACVSFTGAPCTGTTAGGWIRYARSYHPGGVNGLMSDGSVSFFSNNIDLTTVWQPLGTRAGGEVIPSY